MQLNKIRKRQAHSDTLRSWNYRGTVAVAEFIPAKVLAGDNWVLMSALPVLFNGLMVYPGDMALALVDGAGALTAENVEAGQWRLIRNQGVVGGVLVAKSVFYVSSENYDNATKRLTITDFADTPMSENDNVIIKVNGMAYNNEAFAVADGSNWVVWKPDYHDAGFDLEIDDLVEVMVFRK
jgi:hypothetical protein